MKTVQIGDITVGGGKGLFLLAGPCVIEDYDRTLAIGKRAKSICDKLGVPYIFKASLTRRIALVLIPSVVLVLKKV